MIKTANRIATVEEYYFSKKLAEVRSLDTGEVRVINLGIGSPDQAPSSNAIQALDASAQHPANHGYQNYKGIPAFRKAIADFYKNTYQVVLDPETMILPLMGSKEGIMHISMAFVNEGDEVLVRYTRLHTLDAEGTTVPAALHDLVATGAAAYAALEWASFATNRVNVGGAETWRNYHTWAQERLAAFARALAKRSRERRLRSSALRTR